MIKFIKKHLLSLCQSTRNKTFCSVLLLMVLSNISPVSAELIDVGTYKIWMQRVGEGNISLVFINGNGSNSTVWANITPDLADKGVQTVIYDRAGLGNSELAPGPYLIEDEANALNKALGNTNITGPIIFVAHSYGGLISLLAAENNPQIKGLIFVDAVLPDELNDVAVAHIMELYPPQFPEIERQAPQLAKAVIPVIMAYPTTAKRMQKVSISPSLPFIDIVAEHAVKTTPAEITQFSRLTHSDFVNASVARTSVLAVKSGHQVMRDRPDVIIEAIDDMLAMLKSRNMR